MDRESSIQAVSIALVLYAVLGHVVVRYVRNSHCLFVLSYLGPAIILGYMLAAFQFGPSWSTSPTPELEPITGTLQGAWIVLWPVFLIVSFGICCAHLFWLIGSLLVADRRVQFPLAVAGNLVAALTLYTVFIHFPSV